ncbi:MAG: TRAP transporter large permease subunit [Alphaproteobacteria bacterium]|nr:TRAP transporter large permease subunit [Alphaproteobacteria bacterium]
MSGTDHGGAPGHGGGWLPRIVAAALLLVLSVIVLQATADKIDARLVQLGDAVFPGYAIGLRNDPTPPACDLDEARETLKTCVPATGATQGGGGEADPFGTPDEADPFGTPDEVDPFGTPAEADPFGTPAEADPFGTPEEADPFGTPAEADPFGTPAEADPFGTPAEADPFATPAGDDPFGTPAGDDPFAAAPAAAATGVPCAAAEALVEQCSTEHDAYARATAALTPTVKAFRAVELFFRDLANFAYGLHLLTIVLLLGGLQATWLRAHIALRPAKSVLDHRVSQGAQLVAHLLLAFSAVADWRVRAGVDVDLDNGEIPLIWAIGFGLLALINLRHMVRPPDDAPRTGGVGAALLTIPLYAWMITLAGLWFLGAEQHWSGQAIYLHKFAQIPSVYLAVALYVWSGMLLERTSISEKVFDLVRPWKLPVPLLAWVVVIAAALPTAYSGASGIFVIAAGAVVFEEMRKAGASTRQARMVTAMSGSLGVVLRPCLIVVLIASLNKEVTTDQLYGSGMAVFGLTAVIFFLVLMIVYRPKLSVAPAGDALPASLSAAGRLAAPVLIGVGVVAVYAFGLDAPLNERTAPWILPTLLLLILVWERLQQRGRVEAPSVPRQLFFATKMTGEHVGALLFLMAATVGIGGVVERAELMEALPQSFGSPVATMGVLVFVMVLVGMTMDAMGAVILVSVTVADVAYRGGIDPVHFWMMVLVAFELGYLTPPVALNHLLTRQVVGEAADVPPEPGMGFFARYEHVLVPMIVMGLALLLVAFVPFLWVG